VTALNNDLLRDAPPAQWERLEIERDGFMIEAWLLKPPGFDPAKRYPLVLDIHGGPHGHFGYSFNVTQQCLATYGFLVLAVNPRGSTSYGREFTQAVNRDWGGGDYQDLMAMLDRVLERPYADAARTGASGYSYGGYMTAWIVGQTDRFKAVFCGAPVFDLESQWGTADIDHAAGEREFFGEPHEHPEWYAKHSPSTYAHRATSPTLLMQGEADNRCPLGQAEQMFVALKKAGCEVEFVRYPGMSHGFRRTGPPLYQEDSLRRILGWFKHYLGDPV
jgi:dipeptidyl aminopeptidase/acylaminoacyl peptidase